MRKMEIMDKYSVSNRRYLGSKAKLIPFIEETIAKHCPGITSVADIFGGTGIVGYSFNHECDIIENDILESNHQAFIAFFGSQPIDEAKVNRMIEAFNKEQPRSDNYFSDNFSDKYFSRENCRKIGKIREDIEAAFNDGSINERERAILITSLLYSMDKIANTVGHYDAWIRGGHLDRVFSMRPLELPTIEENAGNQVFREDANELVRRIHPDLVYIDTPYNSRQYCDAYHLLENVAEWKKPAVSGVAGKMLPDASEKSRYCLKSAPEAFDDLIQGIDAKYILVSYNSMGKKGNGRSQAKISDEDIVSSLSKRGSVQVFEMAHNQFTAGKSEYLDNKERLFLCVVGTKKNQVEIKGKPNSGFVKSPLNFTGGKFRILKEIIPLFPKDIGTFVDAFAGGFNVGANIKADKIIYNDASRQTERLVQLMDETDPRQLSDEIDAIAKKFGLSDSTMNGYGHYGCDTANGLGSFNKPGYIELREAYNKAADGREKDLLLFVLVVFGFNNQIRFNSSGDFNIPVGKRDFNSIMRRNLKEFSDAIRGKDVAFLSEDFAGLTPDRFSKPFYYFDPPYLLGEATYNENGGWNEEQEKRLMEFIASLDRQGIRFALSNVLLHKGNRNEILLDACLTNGYNIRAINRNYANANYHLKGKAQPTLEVLITNY